jgi:ribonuclease BN (tRNA processing enzyme)
VKLHVLGGCGGWPAAGQACSGYFVECEGFRLLIDPGYATLPRLLELTAAELIDGVLISHGHPDHCADLHPLLRARALRDKPPGPLAVYTLPNAIDRVLALDRPGMLDDAYAIHEFAPGDRFEIGPLAVVTWSLPHFVTNVGMRLTAGGQTLAYTGDTGPSSDLEDLARDADLYLAEATYPELVPTDSARYLSSAKQVGELSSHASVKHLVLTHLWPGTDPAAAEQAARRGYDGTITVARAGVIVDLE